MNLEREGGGCISFEGAAPAVNITDSGVRTGTHYTYIQYISLQFVICTCVMYVVYILGIKGHSTDMIKI